MTIESNSLIGKAAFLGSISWQRYRSIRAAHSTGLNRLELSPMQAAYARDHDGGDTDTLRESRAKHTAVLEPLLYDSEYAIWDGGVRRGKNWEQFKSDHAGTALLTASQDARVKSYARAVRSHPIVRNLLGGCGATEVSAVGIHAQTAVAIKVRLDLVHRVLVDLKSCESLSERKLELKMLPPSRGGYGYALQFAAYRAVMSKAIGSDPLPFYVIWVQQQPPHEVAVRKVSEAALEYGASRLDAMLVLYRKCTDSGTWPAAEPGFGTQGIPEWAESEFYEKQLGDLAL